MFGDVLYQCIEFAVQRFEPPKQPPRFKQANPRRAQRVFALGYFGFDAVNVVCGHSQNPVCDGFRCTYAVVVDVRATGAVYRGL